MKNWHASLDTIYRYRLIGKRAISFCKKVLPRPMSRLLTNFAEKIAFRFAPNYQADTLPPIFHHWSAEYLAPVLDKFKLKSPEDLYYKEVIKLAESFDDNNQIKIASLGSGAGHMEVQLLESLNSAGIPASIDCVDFNQSLKDQAMQLAYKRGLSKQFKFFVENCNALSSGREYDVIIVNQFFHHVEDLEAFCLAIRGKLRPHGILLTCDVVGRNGHVLWPSVDKVVQDIWESMAPEKRFDWYFNKIQKKYVSVDHSGYSNEGIRAQDVVETLARHFRFDLFIGYGAAIMPFVERRVGFNFNLDDPDDLAFIDRVASLDAEAIRAMKYPASNMIAVLRLPGEGSVPKYFPIDVHDHLRAVRAEKASI